jgi:hypothetical protein
MILHSGVGLIIAPANQTAFVYGVQRVDEHLGTVDWKPSRYSALAKPAYQHMLSLALEASLNKPGLY